MSGMSFDEPITEALTYKWLRDECDVLVLLTHIGYEQDRVLAARFPDADVIIGGHSGTMLRDGVNDHGVLITQAGDNSEAVTQITLEVEDGRVVSSSAKTHMCDEAAPDPEISRVVEEFRKAVALDEQLAENVSPLNRMEAGSLICRALMEGTGAEVAVINSGGVRVHSLPTGPVTTADVYRMDPFGNAVVRVNVTGRDIEKIIREVIETDSGRPACVAGLLYDYQCVEGHEPSAANLRLSDGSPLEPDKVYTLATHSYIAETVLKAYPCELLHTTTEELLIRYLKQQKRIDMGSQPSVTLPPGMADSF